VDYRLLGIQAIGKARLAQLDRPHHRVVRRFDAACEARSVNCQELPTRSDSLGSRRRWRSTTRPQTGSNAGISRVRFIGAGSPCGMSKWRAIAAANGLDELARCVDAEAKTARP